MDLTGRISTVIASRHVAVWLKLSAATRRLIARLRGCASGFRANPSRDEVGMWGKARR